MSVNLDPNMAMNMAASQDLQAKRQQVESLSSMLSEEEKRAKLQDACEGFEAIFIQKMWEQMRATLPKEGFLRGKEEEFWQSMYDQELGKSMASSGGIGLAEMMMEQMDRNNQNLTEAVRVSTTRQPAFQVPPASILPPESRAQAQMVPTQEVAENAAETSPATPAPSVSSVTPLAAMSIYEGEAIQPEAPGLEDELIAMTPLSLVSQTLEELAAMAEEQQQAVMQASAETTVTRITYQTNLPPSQRRSSPVQNPVAYGVSFRQTISSAESPTRQVQPQVETASAIESVAPPTSAAAPIQDTANPAQAAVIQEPEDILAGITPRFIPERFRPQPVAATAVPNDPDSLIKAGGPALRGPEIITQNIALGNPEPPRGSLMAPVQGEVSSSFGWRLDPFTGQRAWHTGIDIKAEPGESVHAAMDGVVTFAGQDPELGHLIIVEHADGLRTFYGHNHSLEVNIGDVVNKGMELAKAGSSGRASGTHVHFEVRRGELALNPEPLLRQQQV